MTTPTEVHDKSDDVDDGSRPIPEGWGLDDVSQFLFKEARLADEADYDNWEALWTDDAIYWVPSGGADVDPHTNVAFIFDNRRRISTRMQQVKTGKRYAQAPPSNLRRVLGNIELLCGRDNGEGQVDLEVGANFIAYESTKRENRVWGGRTTYRLRRVDDEIRLVYKKVVLVDNEKPISTMAFLI
ncbi:aromatic-ring-hydroxylating dioxygenase subunit beta [Dietzia maris]|uniref:aromatic-ring-hydroxylating dioxygenase subunit beta n=1 Tax=Dietzia maris TaxID=37915 RepID=UPI0037CAF1F8